MPLSRIKKEKKLSTAQQQQQQQRMFPVGSMLAVDLYANGNFFEAVLNDYGTDEKDKDVEQAEMHYLDDNNTKGWIDLNVIQAVELSQEKILTLNDSDDKLTDDEKGFLGRRLTVQWSDGVRYSGMISKTMKNKKNFVFISYDDGDKCWYNLSPQKEKTPRKDAPRNTTDTNSKRSSSATSKSARIKNESLDEEEESSSNKKSQEIIKRELQKKYPIGSTIAVDVYHDEHYHDAVVKKYQSNPSKQSQARGEQWVYLHFMSNKGNSKQWIDLNCIKAIKVTPESTRRLDDVKPGEDKGFLGKRITLEWSDGNKYRGIATRSVKDNKYFVFLEYDDGDQCWCDLQRESEWSIEGEDTLELDDDDNDDNDDDDDDDNSSGESSKEEKPRAPPKRKTSAEATGQATKKTKPIEESFDF